jgi:predicted MFS family arabinose efflux permease
MPAQAPITPRARRYTLLLLVLVFTSSHVDRQIVAILAQPIKEAFQISDTEVGLLTGFMFALFYATLGMPMAMWSDRGNRRNIIAISIALWSAMTALCGAAQSFWQLLLARIGVGVGEAGSNPPSHSIIADLYAPHERATAMAVFATGVNLGIMLGYLIGGWVAQILDWRWAFVIAGVPGLAIALLVRMSITEPPRGYSEPHADTPPAPPFREVALHMWRSRILRHVVAAGTLVSFAGYAAVAWVPSYLIRVHGMSSGEAGTVLAFLIGVGGGIGTFGGGWLADRLALYSEGWRAWIVTVSIAVYIPFAAVSYLASTPGVAVAAFAIPAVLGGVYIGTGFAIVQSQIPVHMRSVAAAINLFIVNIVGLGLGPTSVGLISDLSRASYGVDSLRVGLLAMILVIGWGGFHYLRVGQLLVQQRKAKITFPGR